MLRHTTNVYSERIFDIFAMMYHTQVIGIHSFGLSFLLSILRNATAQFIILKVFKQFFT